MIFTSENFLKRKDIVESKLLISVNHSFCWTKFKKRGVGNIEGGIIK